MVERRWAPARLFSFKRFLEAQKEPQNLCGSFVIIMSLNYLDFFGVIGILYSNFKETIP